MLILLESEVELQRHYTWHTHVEDRVEKLVVDGVNEGTTWIGECCDGVLKFKEIRDYYSLDVVEFGMNNGAEADRIH